MEPISPTPRALSLRRYCVSFLLIVVFIFFGFLVYLNDSPNSFPVNNSFTIKSGDTLNSIAKNLKTDHLIRSTFFFKINVILSSAEQKLVAGEYYFSQPVSTSNLVRRFVSNDFDVKSIRVTIPEGLSMSQMSELLSSKLTHFSKDEFMAYSPTKEGYLFPDTYFFMPDVKVEKVIEILQNNFEYKIKTVDTLIEDFGQPVSDVITMASILEEEAQKPEDFKIISGILWKRMKIGMPLQVDCTLGYVTGKASLELTSADLKMVSEYNTYINKGLPPTPIANPGLETIRAAVTPIETPYFYYLSDKNGVIHYAATFAEHIKNREKYLK